MGIDRQHLTNREKTLLVDALRPTETLPELLCEVDLPRSSYFYHRAWLEVGDKYTEVRQVMTDIFERNYRCYGYRRIHASLSDRSVNSSEQVVRRLMKQACLVAATSKRRRYGSVDGRDQSCTRQPAEPRLQRRCTELEVVHRHYGVPDPGRQGVPVTHHRLLRWSRRQLVAGDQSRR